MSAGADLYSHIKSMMYTTVPTYAICLILFTFAGLKLQRSDTVGGGGIVATKRISCNRVRDQPDHPTSLLVLLILSIKKTPAEVSMLSSVRYRGGARYSHARSNSNRGNQQSEWRVM